MPGIGNGIGYGLSEGRSVAGGGTVLEPDEIFTTGNLLVWYDAIKQAAAPGALATMTDFSGNANTATAVGAAVAQANGGDGLSEWLFADAGDGRFSMLANMRLSGAAHIWAVFNASATGVNSRGILGRKNTVTTNSNYMRIGQSFVQVAVAGSAFSIRSAYPLEGVYAYTRWFRTPSNSHEWFENGTEQTTAGTGIAGDINLGTVGDVRDDVGNDSYEGLLRMIAVIDGTASGFQIAAMDSYCASLLP